jgi:probable dihydroxyacetone kinase regulator
MNQKSQTTEEALVASVKHLITVMPFGKITVKEITDEAHVKRPTFYNHFKDKYDVVEYILRQELIEPARSLVACDMINEAIRLMLVTMKRDSEFYIRAERIEGDNSFQHMMHQVFKEVLLDIMSEQLPDEECRNPMLTTENIAEYYAYGITFGICKWIQKRMRLEVDEVMEAFKVLLSESLADIIYHRSGKQNSTNIVKK